MITVFIDTNVYGSLGYNFDKRNIILDDYKTLIKNKEIKNVIISVIDNEIKSHLTNRRSETEKKLNKHGKWIYEVVDKDVVEKNINKELNDYEEFKKDTSSVLIDVSNINPEIVLEKHFSMKAPFEPSKPKEFKDAFFLEAIFKYAKENYSTKYVVATQDSGVKEAIEIQDNKSIITVNSIQEAMDLITNYGTKKKREIEEYLKSKNLSELVNEIYDVSYEDLEEETIDIQEIEVFNVFGLDIIKVMEGMIRVVCNLAVALRGNFSCLDNDNSYFPDDKLDTNIYKHYVSKKELMYICLTVIDVKVKQNKYDEIIIQDFPGIEIEFDDINGKQF